jgi:hypothetical protein
LEKWREQTKAEIFISFFNPFSFAAKQPEKAIQMEMNKRNEHRSEREIINIYCTRVSFEFAMVK